jgi:hypothetical protein
MLLGEIIDLVAFTARDFAPSAFPRLLLLSAVGQSFSSWVSSA